MHFALIVAAISMDPIRMSAQYIDTYMSIAPCWRSKEAITV